MKKCLLYLLIIIMIYSCGEKRILQLPEINKASITEIHDVSHAYLFYDDTKTDSIDLNRKNLISTTNWLINVDKRLTLKQAIPKIKFLQDKKRNAKMHKNKAAKNFYTCNDISIESLGFLEFTNVNYKSGRAVNHYSKSLQNINKNQIDVVVKALDSIRVTYIDNNSQQNGFSKDTNLIQKILDFQTFKSNIIAIANDTTPVNFSFNKHLSFQDYITLKFLISELKSQSIPVDNNEFIY
ncbi:hypothetical protein [Psychroserpens sp. MEBiC05023]